MHLRLSQLAEGSGLAFGTSGVRGLVADMTPALCHCFTQAFLDSLCSGATQVVIGHDLRPSSPGIASACAKAVADSGRRVVYVGALPTPAVAYYAMLIGAPALVVTGSHIPFDRNGIKFYRVGGEISKADEALILGAEVREPEVGVDWALAYRLPPVDEGARAAYVSRYVDFFDAQALSGMRIALYEHSSVGRDVLKEIFEGLGARVIPLGRSETFVPIDTEAVRPEDIEWARRWATEHTFDAIVSTDGDADRPLIGDESGNWLRGDTVGNLCAMELGADVVVTPVSSNTAVERCNAFARVIRTRIGSPYVIDGMVEAAQAGGVLGDVGSVLPSRVKAGRVVAGYEANGGFLLGTPIVRASAELRALATRDAALPAVVLMAAARRRGVPVSVLASGLPQRFTASDRVQGVPPDKSRALLEKLRIEPRLLEQICPPGTGAATSLDETDGLRWTFASGDVVHLRPSGNAPELRCYCEAGCEHDAQALCRHVMSRLLRLLKIGTA